MTSGVCGLPRLLALQCCKNVYRKTHVRPTAGEWRSQHTPQLNKKKLHSEPDLLELCDTAIAGPMRSQIHFFFRAVSFIQSCAKKKISRPPADISAQWRLITFENLQSRGVSLCSCGENTGQRKCAVPPDTELKDTAPSTQCSRMKRSLHTLCVVHAQRVVIDCRLPKQCVIGIVSAMRTEECIRYKMVSHSPWSSQETEQDRKLQKETRAQRQERERGRENEGEGEREREIGRRRQENNTYQQSSDSH